MFRLLNTDLKAYAFITIMASLLYIPFIGNMPLFDWDEINFAECAREMLVSNNYSDVQLYFHPFWEKPPMFIWLQAMSMNFFGVNEFSARFPNALCGVVTLLVLYRTGKVLNDGKFGLTWAFVYACTLLPHLFFKSGIIDPWFNLFIYISVYQLIRHTDNPVGNFGYRTAVISGFFLGLALLTKGPAALILVGLTVTVFFALGKLKNISSFKFMATFFFAFLITGLSWFAVMYLKGHGQVIKEFIDYQVRLFNTEDSDHGGPFIYHFVVLLIGCFPSSLFLILAHKKSISDTPFQMHSKRWMMSLFWVVLILFSIVQTKIVHYSSLCYFPLTYLATYAIQKIMAGQYQWKKWLHVFFICISTLLGIAFILIGCVPFLRSWLISANLIADPFALENLKADVCWTGYEWLIGIIFLVISFFSIIKIRRSSFKFIYLLCLGSLFSVYCLIMIIAPKIEQYSQRAAIEFYKQCALHNFNVESIGFKSYATLFYGQLEPSFKQDASFTNYLKLKRKVYEDQGINVDISYGLIRTNWMKDMQTPKPSCFVAKVNDEEVVKRDCPYLKELYRQNGFIFYIRVFDEKYRSGDIYY
ncbi:MAG: glycosyltransferase family 39 protein [Bacteroidetes bacterium]|nr:glycosyltransferase family 39 protein [Bacteroidota bacterium]MDF2453154.1 glycosyltransferase family 39 protein [Bacteroidota bacterium]